jgi:hypothetical protein
METQIRRKTILDSEKYPRIMYLALLVVSILILFSFVNLVEKENKIKNNLITPVTGFVAQEQENLLNISYLAYYSVVAMIIALIFIVIGKLKQVRKIKNINNLYIMRYYETQ